MPTIAQKLCHDIVEPVIKQSSTNSSKVKSTSKFGNSLSIGKSISKPMRFVHIDKNTSSKIKTSHTNGVTVLKSKTSILKSLAETAVNTLVSGPLRCDNNCVTHIRRRDQQRSCKCGQKRTNFKASSKSIQTLNKKDFSLSDKACTQCVETVTCGTQPFKNSNDILDNNNIKCKSNIAVKLNKNISLNLPGSTRNTFKARIESYSNRSQCITKNASRHRIESLTTNKPSNVRYICAKRWALSNYPTRGPDF